jgi:hypothetical protein
MTATQFITFPHKTRKSCRGGASDVNGKKSEPYISDGSSIPRCHSLNGVAMGDGSLLFAHRPLPRYPALCRGWPYFDS